MSPLPVKLSRTTTRAIEARRMQAEGALAAQNFSPPDSLAPFPFSAIVGQDEMKLAFADRRDRSVRRRRARLRRPRHGQIDGRARAGARCCRRCGSVVGCAYNCDPAATAALCDGCNDAPRRAGSRRAARRAGRRSAARRHRGSRRRRARSRARADARREGFRARPARQGAIAAFSTSTKSIFSKTISSTSCSTSPRPAKMSSSARA